MAGLNFSLPKFAGSNDGLTLQDKLLAFSAIAHGHPEVAMQLPQIAMQRRLYSEFLNDGQGAPGDGGSHSPTQAVQASTDVQPSKVGQNAPLPDDATSDLGGVSIPQLGVKPQAAPFSAADAAPFAPPQALQPARSQTGAPALLDPNDPRSMRRFQLLTLINPQAASALARGALATRPEVAIGPDGQVYNKYDPGAPALASGRLAHHQVVNGYNLDLGAPGAPSFIPTLPGGTMPDGRGGVVNIPGVVPATAEQAGATTDAQEAAKAKYDLVDVPRSDGSVVKVPRSMAILALGGAPKSAVPNGAPGTSESPEAGPVLGVSQTPAQAELAKKQGQTLGERQAAQPEAFAGYRDMSNTTDLTISQISKILGQKQDPKTGAFVDDPAASGGMIHWNTAGLGANLNRVEGTPAHDLESALDVLKGNLAFDRLQQMRDQSPTGGALGRVTQQEINLLSAVRGSLDQGQSPQAFRQQLAQVRDQLAIVRGQRHDLYNAQYGNVHPSGPTTAPVSRAAVQYLRSHPELAPSFDQKYGAGAAKAALGQ